MSLAQFLPIVPSGYIAIDYSQPQFSLTPKSIVPNATSMSDVYQHTTNLILDIFDSFPFFETKENEYPIRIHFGNEILRLANRDQRLSSSIYYSLQIQFEELKSLWEQMDKSLKAFKEFQVELSNKTRDQVRIGLVDQLTEELRGSAEYLGSLLQRFLKVMTRHSPF